MPKKHGMSEHPVYSVWEAMIQRCHNPRCKSYKNYGARGIAVCAEWRGDFAAFYKDMGPRPEGRSIDRINNDGNYEPGNCRWATASQQRRDTRTAQECRNGHPWTEASTGYFTLSVSGKQRRRCLVCRAKREPNAVRILSPGIDPDAARAESREVGS